MKTNTMKSLIESTNIPEPLIRAVVRQIGGWGVFKNYAPDVASHGADAGFPGFTYYTDTVKFTRANLKHIVEMAETMADDFGMSGPVELVRGFRCLSDATEAEVARTLYGSGDGDTQVANAIAWYALEEVCRAYSDD